MLESGECCTEGIKFCYQELITEMHFLFRITIFRNSSLLTPSCKIIQNEFQSKNYYHAILCMRFPNLFIPVQSCGRDSANGVNNFALRSFTKNYYHWQVVQYCNSCMNEFGWKCWLSKWGNIEKTPIQSGKNNVLINVYYVNIFFPGCWDFPIL